MPSNPGDAPELKTLDVLICKIRSKLRGAPRGAYTKTEWGRGYSLVDPPAADSAAPAARLAA